MVFACWRVGRRGVVICVAALLFLIASAEEVAAGEQILGEETQHLLSDEDYADEASKTAEWDVPPALTEFAASSAGAAVAGARLSSRRHELGQ